ncbi:MAG: thioredoxin family protein [Chloroflexi bacterium]|uniref:TM0996/MTH895 family glutaredoxin-like protein n=1 Tax=Candidatus Dechloromonas phosphorivorans TaxID=2899244 RepID=A0A9D7QMQ4_9RHOO|nr:TM0996/MTH895 family glutaredoxin-like protein [Candidatus Dechloromonas phosphorivorans]NTU63403.1 thioredoxin family protein [Chloroflexota bacterium]
MDIKILGSGCAKCKRLEQLTKEAADAIGVEATFDHVTDINKIMAYPIVATPALVINEDVKVAGRMPSKEEITAWLKAV